MNANTLLRLSAGALLVATCGTALAADISMIQTDAASVALADGKALVRFTVSGTAAGGDHCGYFVEYGDGMAGDSRLIENESGHFTRWHERSFSNPGTYVISARGRNVKTTPSCTGAASTTITVVAATLPAAAAARTVATPACPEGWMLNQKSVNWRTGAFSCVPKPAGQLTCGDGLRYYERDGIIGCRQERRNEQSRLR